jgi:hypothetical protein
LQYWHLREGGAVTRETEQEGGSALVAVSALRRTVCFAGALAAVGAEAGGELREGVRFDEKLLRLERIGARAGQGAEEG